MCTIGAKSAIILVQAIEVQTMMKVKADKRISMRTNEHVKQCLEAAAVIAGFNSLSNFVLATAYREAQNILEEAKGRVLSDEDRDIILDALENPPVPNNALKEIMAKRLNNPDE